MSRVLKLLLKYRIVSLAGGSLIVYGAYKLTECCPQGWPHHLWEIFVVWPLHAAGLIPFLKPVEALWEKLIIEEGPEIPEAVEEIVRM